jgi:hypothetical protein
MAETKYGNLVKILVFQQSTMGGANARELVFVGGDQMAGFELNFIVGVYEKVGDWAPNRGAHTHPFDEVLLFFGYDPEDMDYLGADMNLAIGEEQEQHRFSSPMAIPAPKGVPHCPLLTEKVYKPFGHFHLALSSSYAGAPAEKKGKTDGTKYAHFLKEMTAKPGPGGADAKQYFSMSGADLEGLSLNFAMGLYNKPGQWRQAAHTHPYDEILVFFGHNVNDLSYLGADITIEIGPEREKHAFNVPTVVSIPRGLMHYPVICNKADKPYRMMQVGLAAKYKASLVQ